jgi:predicted lipoprotein
LKVLFIFKVCCYTSKWMFDVSRTGPGSLALLALLACGSESGTPGESAPSGFDRKALLARAADGFLVPTYQQFATAAAALDDAITAHCEALGAGSLAAAQEAWRSAIDGWERADAMLVGPAAMDERALRDRVYAWPLASTCGVDEDTAAYWSAPGEYDPSLRLNNVRSLAAIEYLLFVTATEHTCPLAVDGWDQLGADLPAARCGLAAALAGDVRAQAEALWSAWDPAGGDYGRQLTEAGTSASEIESEREAVNHVSDGLFYVDRMVKDMKLAEAAGIADNACGAVEEPCEREVEHRHADHATAAIRINLIATRDAFTGDHGGEEGPGFDDDLRSVDAGSLADDMVAKLDAAIAAADQLPDSFLEALASDYAQVVATHSATKAFTDDLKSQFLTVLGLDVPDDAAADND